MRYAIFSDVHANLRAWEKVLADIRAQEPDVLVCLGDAVGYGPKPEEVLQGIREVTSNFVMGNHDAAAAGAMDYSIFNEHARHSIDWTTGALSAESRKFLGGVPLAIDAGDILFVHAEISEPGRFGYIDDLDKAGLNFADGDHFVTFVGHTHQPNIYQQNSWGEVTELPGETRRLDPVSRYIVNVGSVGEPRDFDDLRGVYVIYDSETREVEFRRVSFDIVAYRRDLESTSLQVKPFFLQSHEFQVAETQAVMPSAAATLAMEAPAAATVLVQRHAAPVQLHVPHQARRPWHPAHAAKPKRSGSRAVVVLTLIAVMLVAAWVIWGSGGGAEEVELENRVAKTDGNPQAANPGGGSARSEPAPESVVASIPEEAPPVLAETAVPPAPAPIKPPPVPVVASVPKPKPKPKPPARKQEPKPGDDPTVAWWRMEARSGESQLADATGQHPLPVQSPGKPIKALAPSKLPANGFQNDAALSLGVWGGLEPASEFALSTDRSFTLEAWVVTARLRSPVFLAGTRSGDANDKQGWHVDIRRTGQMCFFYDNGPGAVQALSEILPVGNLKPHHFAAVWDHDASGSGGEMRLYFEGEQVASTAVPHAQIPDAPANPFRIGAPTNPQKIGLDEVRFVHAALSPLGFLRAEAQTMTKSGNWADADNWSGGEPPSGTAGAVIGAGVSAELKALPPKFAGDLALAEGAKLSVPSFEAFEAVVPEAPSKLVLHTGSQIVITAGNGLRGGVTTFGRVELAGDAKIWGGRSTSGHHTKRDFSGELSGSGSLTLDGVNNNEFVFRAASTFDGGLIAISTQKQGFRVCGKVAGSLGKGDVEIRDSASLRLQAEGAISPEAKLVLSGAKDSRSPSKLTLDADSTVAGLIFDDEEQAEGTWGAKGSGADHEHEYFSGGGVLTVTR